MAMFGIHIYLWVLEYKVSHDQSLVIEFSCSTGKVLSSVSKHSKGKHYFKLQG